MNYARNYKNLLNFIKVMPKILVVPFFPDTVYICILLLLSNVITAGSKSPRLNGTNINYSKFNWRYWKLAMVIMVC